MARKRYKPEEIVAKLRQVDVLVSQGQGMTEAIHLQPAKFLTPTIVGHLAHTDLPVPRISIATMKLRLG